MRVLGCALLALVLITLFPTPAKAGAITVPVILRVTTGFR